MSDWDQVTKIGKAVSGGTTRATVARSQAEVRSTISTTILSILIGTNI